MGAGGCGGGPRGVRGKRISDGNKETWSDRWSLIFINRLLLVDFLVYLVVRLREVVFPACDFFYASVACLLVLINIEKVVQKRDGSCKIFHVESEHIFSILHISDFVWCIIIILQYFYAYIVIK